MTTQRMLKIKADGSVSGLRVVGFHGHMEIDETPAKLGPVYANTAGCLVHIVDVGPTQWTRSSTLRIESFPPPLSADEPLPGEGTRIGPWEARHENIVMAVGPLERARIAELRDYARARGTALMQQFIEWFEGRENRQRELKCERQGELAFWYCSVGDGFSLLECVHRVVEDAFFQAVRSKSRLDIEEMAWWLSRAAVDDQDIFLAGAALRLIASPDWKALIRETLHLPNEKDWKAGLQEAKYLLENPPPVPESVPEPPVPPRFTHREAVRKLFSPERAA